jgi:hypothetical protein
MQAKNLKSGQQFEIPSCRKTMRNLVCLRVSGTAVTIDGEQLEEVTHFESKKTANGKMYRMPIKTEKVWKRLSGAQSYIALATNVEIDPSKPLVNVQKDANNQLFIENEDKPRQKNKRNLRGDKRGGKRGRKKMEIAFPKGKFIVPELATELNCSVTTIYSELKRLEKVGKAKIVDKQLRERGKPTPIWRVLTKN